MKSRKPVLVGMQNPYGADPAMALYPLPPNASGGRLLRILGLTTSSYLRDFDRANLCDGPWSPSRAKVRAVELAETGRPLVLLGASVCEAFETKFAPFTIAHPYGETCAAVLPHPSGRCTLWNAADARDRARDTVTFLRAHDVEYCTACLEHHSLEKSL